MFTPINAHFLIYISDVLLKVTKSNALIVNLFTFACYVKKKLPEKQIEFHLLCFRFRKQQKVTKLTMNALDLVTFNKTSEM